MSVVYMFIIGCFNVECVLSLELDSELLACICIGYFSVV